MFCIKIIKCFLGSCMVWSLAGAAEETVSMQYLIDGTKSDTPFQLADSGKNGSAGPAKASDGVVTIRRAGNMSDKQRLYVIEFDDDVFEKLKTICALHDEANKLNETYIRLRKTAKNVEKCRQLLNQSSATRKSANKQMEKLLAQLESNKKVRLFILTSVQTSIKFSGKKIFLALRVTGRGAFVPTSHRVFSAGEENKVWTLK